MSGALWRSQRRGKRPMIYGRDRERAQLRELLDDTIEGHGALALISGEAGIGKTTLATDLVQQAMKNGALVLSGHCYAFTTTPPYSPWIEITAANPVAENLPELPPQLRSGAGLEGIPSQGALFNFVSTFVSQVAACQPLVLLLEDLHWADAASLDLLRFLARSLNDQSILIIATYRDDELTRQDRLFQLIPSLVREANAARLDLDKWTADDIQRLLSASYRLVSQDVGRLAAYLLDRSDGNPLFMAELLRGLEAEAVLRSTGEAWELGDLDDVPVPTFVVQFIEGRLSTLDPHTRSLVEILAAIGHQSTIELWAQVAGVDSSNLVGAALEAIEAHVIEEVDRGESVRFRHALVQEALYSGLVSLQRQEWHRAVVEILLDQSQPDPDLILTHLERANDPRRVEWLIKAGERARSSFAWEVAVERFSRALESVEADLDATLERQFDLLMALGGAKQQAGIGRTEERSAFGDLPSARDSFSAAAEIARLLGSGERMAQAALGVTASAIGVSFDPIVTTELLEESLSLLPDQDSSLRAMALARLALEHWNAEIWSETSFANGKARQIQLLADDAVAMARRVEDQQALAFSLTMRSWGPGRGDDLDALLGDTEETVQLAEQTGDAHTKLNGLDQLIAVHWLRGDITRIESLVEEYRLVAEPLHNPFYSSAYSFHRLGRGLTFHHYDEVRQWITGIAQAWPNNVNVIPRVAFLCRELGRLHEITEQEPGRSRTGGTGSSRFRPSS